MAKKENPERKRVHLRLSKENHDLIEARAKAAGKTKNAYAKEAALHGKVVTFDYKYFEENNNYMKEVTNDIRLLIYTILQTQEYFPIDLERVNDSLSKIIENQEGIIREIRKENRNLRKILKENVRDIEVEKSDY